MREVVATGQPRSGIEIESFAPDNRDEPHFWQMSFFALPLGTDRRGLGIIGLDVTKIKRAEAELRDALRVRDEFLSIASHELKTPLTAIQLSIQNQARMLRAAGSGAPLGRLARSSEILSKEIRRLSALVDNLLDVSRISAGKLMLSPEPTNFSVLVREVLLREMPVLNRAGIKLTLEIEDGIALELDRLRLDQVVTNLVSNAVKYAPGSGLGVCLRRDGETIRLDVCDGGPGLAPGDEIKIFSRFERAAASATSIQGLGLGLYISRQIIEAHGGLITVANGSEIGACFTIALPLQAKGKLV
jgi:signal transduction histidine kinase